MLQMQVDRGQGYVDLAYDTTPGYTDTHPFPATLTTWKYRAIYRVGDAQVGVWSAEMGIAVGG
jgi:alpha-D-ribose 1-methylphosphonate 5-triphosphate synthase subunit PhnI